jgi:hypothetical protein
MLDLSQNAYSSLELNLPKYDDKLSLRRFTADKESLTLGEGQKGSITFTVIKGGDLVTTRTYEFTGGSYDLSSTPRFITRAPIFLSLPPN